ncbi:MAG: OmpA family protein, partial [Acidobacteria bacterium]|nr:OmpA family protein [Acidobacteriota bacterium]
MTRTLGLGALASLLMVGLLPQKGTAQVYQAPSRATPKEVYCSGFISSSRLPRDLLIIGAEDRVGELIYTENEYVYLGRGRDGGVNVGQRYLVVRRFNDPNPTEAFGAQTEMIRALGHLYHDIGQVEVKIVHDTTATALVTAACDALQMGDILIPFQERPVPEYRPLDGFDRFAPPSGSTQGTVLLGHDFAYALGQGDAAYVNLGTAQGAKVGDYLRFYRWGQGTNYEGFRGKVRGQWRYYRGVPWNHPIPIDTKIRKRLPREVLGEGVVVHVDQNTSTVVITFSLREIHPGDYAEVQKPTPPTAELTVRPARITRGEWATLSWVTTAANDVTITPVPGSTSRRGTENVWPEQTTTYRLAARGPFGTAEATATLTVVEPPPPPAPPARAPAGPSLEELFARSVQDIFFEFNKADITPEAMSALRQAADFLRAHPQARVRIEGHCDEVGSDEYNMALGAR